MSFIWTGRTDDDLAWRWNESESGQGIVTDNFRKVRNRFEPRYGLSVVGGRGEGRETTGAVGTLWTITSGASWDLGDLLRLNDPDNEDFDLRELNSTTETVQCAAAQNVVSGALPVSEFGDYLGSEFPAIWNATSVDRLSTTDVNSTVPTTAHIGQQASLDNSSGWQLDLSGSGAVEITKIDTNRNRFIVKFLDAFIQPNPHNG